MVRVRPRWPFESRIKTRPARLPTSKASSSKASNVKASTSKAHLETNNLLNTLLDLDDKSSPKKTKKRRLLTTQEQESIPNDDDITYNIKVSNRFSPIESDDSEMDFFSEEELRPPPTQETKPRKPPPIIVHCHMNNPVAFFSKVHALANAGIDIKCTRDKTVFLCKSLIDHKAVTELLEIQKIPFHTYPLPGLGLVKLVLRGLSMGVTIEDIKVALTEKGFPPKNIIQLKNKETSQPIPIFVCMFAPGTSQQDIYKINGLCYMRIWWTKYRNRAKFIQCYRCLGFNHTQLTCRGIERCMKCGSQSQHRNSECQSKTMKCINCGGGHWANSEECPAVQRAIKIREGSREDRVAKSRSSNKIAESEEKTRKLQKDPTAWSQTDFPKLPNTVPNFSPANPESWPKPDPKQDDASTIQEIISLLKNSNISAILTKILNILKMLIKAKDGAERLQILLEEGVALLG